MTIRFEEGVEQADEGLVVPDPFGEASSVDEGGAS